MATPRPVKPSVVTVRRTYEAPRDRVFRAWTQKAELEKWFAPGPLRARMEADVRTGGRFRVEMHGAPDGPYVATGTYQEVKAPERLVFTWGWEGQSEHAKAKDSLVTVTFRDLGGKTEVTLVHERLPTSESAEEHREGWESCLENLAKALGA